MNASAITLVVLAVSCSGATSSRSGDVAASPKAFDRLEPSWTADSGPNTAIPAIADGVVYAVSFEHGVVSAYPAQCGSEGATCPALWRSAPIGKATWPAVGDGGVFVAGYADLGSGFAKRARLFAFDVGCGEQGATCDPTWSGSIPGGVTHDLGPVIAGGFVYVPTVSGIYAFSTACATDTCRPVWHNALDGHPAWALAVTDNEVFVGTDLDLLAYPASCATGGACSVEWVKRVPSAPSRIVLSGDEVIVGTLGKYDPNGRKGEAIYAYPSNCSRVDGCPEDWYAHTKAGAFVAVDGGMVFAQDQVSSGGVYAYRVDCASDGSRCAPTWFAPAPDALGHDLVAADGVVYVGSQDGELIAYPQTCATPCAPSWTGQAGGSGDWVSPSASGATVFAGSDRLYAFAPTKT